MKPKRILLVDDSVRDTELALDAFSQYHLGNDVATLRDGVEALDYLYCRGAYTGRPDGNPALILLDLKMPRLDGLAVLKELKQDPQLQTIPVVVMTSSREEQDIVNSYQLGVNAYVVKPMEFHAFVDAIQRIGAFWMVLNEMPRPDTSAGPAST